MAAVRPPVAMTAVTPSSSGRPAATSAPNASSRITIVSGSESVSAFLRSSSNIFETALPVLASPNCSMFSSGCAFCAAAVAARIGSTLSSAFSESPLISKVTTAEWPSREIWPTLPLAYGD